MVSPSLVHAVIGDYRLLEFLGAGGMGEVYRGVHTKIGRSAAVKILTAAAPGSDFVERFLNEARLHATLHHPNIATLYDFLEFEGRPCIVMEYVDGQTLTDRLRLQGPLDPADAWPIFVAVVSAVAYVHDQGIIHRDLKTANIRINCQGVVKLLDFGIAKGVSTPNLTQSGSVVGTLSYMPPEQLKGEPATKQADVWALGIVLYEMLTGRVPFEATTAGELIEKIRTGGYPRLATLRPAADPLDIPLVHHADQLVVRCLRRNPADRYPDAGAMLQSIPAQVAACPSPEAASLPSDGIREEAARKARVAAGRLQSLLAGAASRLGVRGAAPGVPLLLALCGRYWVHLSVAALAIATVVWLTFGRAGPAGGGSERRPRDLTPAAAGEATSLHRIEVAEGAADVYINDVYQGRTPYEYRARPHETVTLGLKQRGFVDFSETFDVTTRKVWTLAMKREASREPSP